MQKLEIFGFQGSEALYMFSEDTQGLYYQLELGLPNLQSN